MIEVGCYEYDTLIWTLMETNFIPREGEQIQVDSQVFTVTDVRWMVSGSNPAWVRVGLRRWA